MKKKIPIVDIVASPWFNNKNIIRSNVGKIKPCHELQYCPFGTLVEEFPFKDNSKFSCKIFGHCCPTFFLAEDITE